MDTTEYEKKADEILNKSPFVKLTKDPTARNEKRVNDTLKSLRDANEISQSTYENLRVSENGTRTPLFYGSAKIHKANMPLRPIVSTVGSATYKIAKRLNTILAPYARQADSHVTNTRDFVEKIEDIEIEDDEVMVSYDVKSLFTSVPVDDAYAEIEKVLRADPGVQERTGMGVEAVLKLLKLCLSMTNFKFRNKHYALSDGSPMGSPASPVIANIYMRALEERALSTFELKPKVWYRYVDDVFSITKKTHVPKLLQHLNNQHPSIRFTEESEKEGKLPFLEVNINRTEDRHVHLSIYRKPTHSSRYLQYASNHTDSAKRSVAQALFNRVKHVTKEEDKRQEEQLVEEELTMNNFPQEVIVREKKMARKRNQENERMEGRTDGDTSEGKESKRTVTIPYIKGMSEAIRRVLAPLGIRTAMRSERIKWSVLRGIKDREDKTEVPGVVYAVGCEECKEVYIGETKRKAQQRIKEHKADTRIGRVDKSAIAEHAHVTGHKIYWEPMVIEREQHGGRRKVKEALHIHCMKRRGGSMNQDSGWQLSKIWLDLVQ